MKNSQLIGLSLVVLASFAAACSDSESPTGVANDLRVRTVTSVTLPTICSQDGGGGAGGPWVATPQNPVWSPAVAPGIWVGKTATASTDYLRKTLSTYNTSFTVPAGATNISISGHVLADNAVVIFLDGPPRIHASGNFGILDAALYNFPVGLPDNLTFGNFVFAGGVPFGAPVPAAGSHNVTFLVYNDDNLNVGDLGPNGETDVNPSGLSFCYDVTYDEAPPVIIGQGCSPGYWKNHNFPAGYLKTQAFNSNLPGTDFENAFPGKNFQTVLSDGGGGLTALGRATVSAYFNAVALGANYGLTPDQVVNMFNAVYPGGDYNGLKAQFEALQDVNGRRCPNPTGN